MSIIMEQNLDIFLPSFLHSSSSSWSFLSRNLVRSQQSIAANLRIGAMWSSSLLCALSQLLLAGAVAKVKVAIAGAGPAGLLTAQALLSRGDLYDVRILEAGPDPRYAPPGPRAYSLGLNIRGQWAVNYFESKGRAQGLWGAIKQRGVESDSFFLHIGKNKFQIRKPSKAGVGVEQGAPPPTLLIQRNELCAAMLDQLEAQYGTSTRNSGEGADSSEATAASSSCRLKTHFGDRLDTVDLEGSSYTLASGRQFQYDLLVGSDGVQSAVRKALMQAEEGAEGAAGAEGAEGRGFYSEEVLLPGQFKVMVLPCPLGIENDAVHAMESSKKTPLAELPEDAQADAADIDAAASAVERGAVTAEAPLDEGVDFSLFLIPATQNRTCVLVSTRKSGPKDAGSSSSPAPSSSLPLPLQDPVQGEAAQAQVRAIQREIAQSYPQFGAPPAEAVQQLLEQRPSEVRTVRCNRYSRGGGGLGGTGGVLLLGDSAHSTGGALGQGANSALLDVVALDQCLDAHNDADLAATLALFSQRQVPEGLALWQLLQLPPKGPLGILYQLSQFWWGFWSNFKSLRRALRLPLPTQNTLSQTLTPFTEIVRRNRFWIKAATKVRNHLTLYAIRFMTFIDIFHLSYIIYHISYIIPFLIFPLFPLLLRLYLCQCLCLYLCQCLCLYLKKPFREISYTPEK
jgi:2-polyprenyl-6-methoxyphenol hydroxylase-like FAD-dependent oxidoreductase